MVVDEQTLCRRLATQAATVDGVPCVGRLLSQAGGVGGEADACCFLVAEVYDKSPDGGCGVAGGDAIELEVGAEGVDGALYTWPVELVLSAEVEAAFVAGSKRHGAVVAHRR